MFRQALIAALCGLTGCLFTGEELPANGEPNNDVEPNNGTVDNVATNNTDNSATNNVVSTNIEPNVAPNNVVDPCGPEVAPGCGLPFTCSPDGTSECPRCGVCDGVCAATEGSPIGVCLQVAPIGAVQEAAGDDPALIGRDVAVADRIYVGQPGRGAGRVIVANLDGTPDREIANPDAAGTNFGWTVDAIESRAAIGCPGCGPQGQVFFMGDTGALEPVYTTAAGDPREPVGQFPIAVMDAFDRTRVIACSPDAQGGPTALVFQRDDAGWALEEAPMVDTVLFGQAVEADQSLVAIGAFGRTAQTRFAAPQDWVIRELETAGTTTRLVAISQRQQGLLLGGEREIELFELRDTAWDSVGIQRAGSGTFIAAAYGEQLVFAGLSTDEVRIFHVVAGSILQLGSFTVPGLTSLDAHDGVLVAGAADATGPGAVYAWRIAVNQ